MPTVPQRLRFLIDGPRDLIAGQSQASRPGMSNFARLSAAQPLLPGAWNATKAATIRLVVGGTIAECFSSCVNVRQTVSGSSPNASLGR
jgi:hypothetical protein